ncbi:MAG: histidine kinase N-terminal 7TM domain-containing protein [Cyanobacteria bacterium J06649_4]
MSSSFLLIALLPAIAAFVSGSLCVYAWQRREVNGARAFSLCTASTFVWCFFSVFEYLSLGESARLIFGKAQYLGITTFPPLWLLFTLQYAQSDHWITRRFLVALGVIPGVSLLLAVTDQWHGWIWRSAWLEITTFPKTVIVHGWWFEYVLIPQCYLLLIAGFGVLLKASFVGSRLYRRQTLFLMGAAMAPFICNVLYVISDITLFGLDITPVGFVIAGCLIYFGLFRAGFLDIAPISYKTVFVSTADAVILLDAQRRIVDLNPSAVRESGRVKSAEAAVGRYLEDIFSDYGELFSRLISVSLAPTQAQTEWTETIPLPVRLPNRHTGQTQIPFREVKVRSLISPGNRKMGWMVMIRDVTLEKQQQERLEQFAYIDSLTGLSNRRQLELKAEAALRQTIASEQVALLYLDLNHFKPINDQYGHGVGDEVLQYFAKCLSHSVRKGDVVARLGGDEFAALLYDADAVMAAEVRERLLHTLDKRFCVGNHCFTLSASIGVAYYPTDGNTLQALMRHADQKMYREKRSLR